MFSLRVNAHASLLPLLTLSMLITGLTLSFPSLPFLPFPSLPSLPFPNPLRPSTVA